MLELWQQLHPKCVHFPIALFVTAAVLDVLSWIFVKDSWHKAAVVMYVCGVVVLPMVVVTGLLEQQRLHLAHPLVEEHKFYGFITLGLALLSVPLLWFCKKAYPHMLRLLFTVLMVLLAIGVAMTAHEGGEMVYEYGMGVAE